MITVPRWLACSAAATVAECLVLGACAAPVPSYPAYRHAALQTATAMVSSLAAAELTVRGAEERRRGVIAASTGNHGQSVAYAADLFGVRAVICMPEQANPVKVESMRRWARRAAVFPGAGLRARWLGLQRWGYGLLRGRVWPLGTSSTAARQLTPP